MATTSCGDTDVSFAVEELGEFPVLINGRTYVRGYDTYVMVSSGVVCTSKVCEVESADVNVMAKPSP